MLFNELASQKIPKEYFFRVKFGQAVALEKNKDRLLALKSYKEIAALEGLTPQEREELEYRLGNLLLKLNQEEEGKAYLGYVLRNSENRELRSQALTSIADYYFEQRRFDKSAENYSLALQEDRYNVRARVGLEQSLKNLGKDANYTDIFPENLDYLYSPEPNKQVFLREKKKKLLIQNGLKKGVELI
jgi:tetratricopeptide (TPR) repeat protein